MRWRLVILGSLLCLRLLGQAWFGRGVVLRTGGNDNGGVLIGTIRSKMVTLVRRNLPEPEAGLVLGVVMGFKSSLDKRFYANLVNSGTVHMVVASGYNVMLVASLALGIFLFAVSRRLAVMLSILVMGFYALLAGGEVSVIRASLMGSLAMLALTFGRVSRPWWILLVTVWLMLMIEPALVESISFQLSVAATFGVVVLAPLLSAWLSKSGAALASLVARLDLTATLCAIFMTAPLIFFHFGRGSLISPLSNSLILPLVPILMALGGIMLTFGSLLPVLGGILAWSTYALAHTIVVLVNFFGGVY